MKNRNELPVMSNELKDKGSSPLNSSRITHHASRFFILLLIACCFFSFAGTSGAAEKGSLMSDIRQSVLKELMSSVSESVELNGLRVIKGADVIRNEVEYELKTVAMNGYNGGNKAAFSVSLSDRKLGTREVIVEASYDILVDVFITSRPLAGGTVLTGDEFYTMKQKSSKIPVGAILNKNELEGKMLKTNVVEGVILKEGFFNIQSQIKRGRKVNVIVEGGNVVISAQGVLRNDALIGGAARVWCSMSKKEVNGILVSSDTVKVKI